MKIDPYAYLDEDPYGDLDNIVVPKSGDDLEEEVKSALLCFGGGGVEGPVAGKPRENVKNAFGVLQRVADRYLRKE